MSIIATRLDEYRTVSNVGKYNNRASRYGALDLFQSQTNSPGSIITEDLKQKAMNSDGRTLRSWVFDQENVSITTGTGAAIRPLEVTDSENTTRLVDYTFVGYSFGFTQVPAAFKNNEVQMQEDFNMKLRKYLNKLGATLDNACLSALSTAKTSVINDKLNYTFVGNTIDCEHDKYAMILGDTGIMMRSNDFYDGITIVGNGGIQSILNQLAKSDTYNAENQRYEWSNKTFGFTNRLSNDTGKFGTMYAVNGSSVGLLFRHEVEAMMDFPTSHGKELSTDVLPELGIPVTTYYYEGFGDQTSIVGAGSSHLQRATKRYYGFTVEVCYVTAHITDPSTMSTPVIKIQIANPA